MRKRMIVPKKTLGDLRPCAIPDPAALCVPAPSGLYVSGRIPADRCLADGSHCIPSRMHMLPPSSASAEVMLPPRAPLPRGVHRGANEHGAPVYFATCEDGRVLYGVHSPEQIEEVVVLARLSVVLDREDPPSVRCPVSGASVLAFGQRPLARPQSA
jgi:hypothetical protein